MGFMVLVLGEENSCLYGLLNIRQRASFCITVVATGRKKDDNFSRTGVEKRMLVEEEQ